MLIRLSIIVLTLSLAIAGPVGGATSPVARAQSTGPIRISQDLSAAGSVDSYSISPDSRLVAYCITNLGVPTLWLTAIDGSSPAAQVPAVSGCVPASNWIGSNGAALMLGATDPYPSATTPPTLVETAAPYPSRPLFTLPSGYVVYRQIRWSPDGEWIFFSAGQEATSRFAVFVAPIDGSAPARQLTPDVPSGSGGAWDFEVTRDLSRLVVVSDELIPGTSELVARTLPVDLLGGTVGAPVRLNGTLPTDGDVGFWSSSGSVLLSFSFTTDQSRVVYFADQASNEDRAIYSVPIDRSAEPTRLTSALAANDGFEWVWPPRNDYVWYFVRNTSTFRNTIYRAPVAGPATATTLIVDNGFNIGYAAAANGERAVISGSRDNGGSTEIVLWIGPMGGQAADFEPVTTPAPTGLTYYAPNGNALVYVSSGLQRIDLTAPDPTPVALNAIADYGVRVSNARVVFGSGSAIYTQPLLDPTGVSESISGGLPIDGYAADFKLADNDQWVLFRSQVDTNRYELYASNVGAPPVLGRQLFLPALSRNR